MLQFSTNVILDVYRGFDAGQPYPPDGTVPALTNVTGFLRHHVKAGKFGYPPWHLYWTHVLTVPPGTDIRSAYNSELNALDSSKADTILLSDYPVAGRCTAFMVVLVQEINRGSPGAVLRIFLDRCKPRLSPCPKKPKSLQSGCCPNTALPTTLFVTMFADGSPGCLCGDGAAATMAWDDGSQTWSGTLNLVNCSTTLTVTLDLACNVSLSGCASAYTTKVVDSSAPFQISIFGGNAPCCNGVPSGWRLVITE
jgi:hypothetical protein